MIIFKLKYTFYREYFRQLERKYKFTLNKLVAQKKVEEKKKQIQELEAGKEKRNIEIEKRHR